VEGLRHEVDRAREGETAVQDLAARVAGGHQKDSAFEEAPGKPGKRQLEVGRLKANLPDGKAAGGLRVDLVDVF
jgi:hypothetical protein